MIERNFMVLLALQLFDSTRQTEFKLESRPFESQPKKDNIAEVIEEVETLRILPLIETPKMKNFSEPITNDTVAEAELVQYISEVQAVVVALRQSYLDILRGHAEWTARWYELHFPDFYPCVTRTLIKLMRESMTEYPKKVIMKIRTLKDAFLRSYLTRDPISQVDPEVFEGLNELLWNMPEVLTHHRDGKDGHADGVESLLETQVRRHEDMVRGSCNIPLTDGHTSRREHKFSDYDSDEDYSPLDYFSVV